MKKPNISPLIVLTILFALLLSGIYVFRNYSPTAVSCEVVSLQKQLPHAPITDADLVNINTASTKELSTLPGIGDVLAQRIVNYRKNHGSFDSPDALLNVEGIGKGKLESILDFITTGGN